MKRHRGGRALDIAGGVGAVAWAALAWSSRGPTSAQLGILLPALGIAWAVLWVALRALPPEGTAAPAGSRTVRRVIFWGLAFRVIGLIAEPVLEDDWYRYLWDGYRFAQAGTPYGQAPMEFFADAGIPERFHAVLDGINNPDLPTVYGPVPQFAFLAAFKAAPGSLLPLKILLIGAELIVAFLLYRRFRSTSACLLWFWCPLLIQESAFNAHPESLGLLGLVVALCCGAWRFGGPAIPAALAAGTRPFGAILVPFLLSWRRPSQWLVFGVTLSLLYLPFILRGGVESVSVAAMAAHWEFNSSGYALLAWLFGGESARVVSALLFGVSYLAILSIHLRRGEAIPPGDRVLGVLFLLSPVANPWYLLWMLPFAILRRSLWAWTALIVVSLSYAHGHALGDPTLGGYEHPSWLRPVEFGAVGLALGYEICRNRWGRLPRVAGFASVPHDPRSG